MKWNTYHDIFRWIRGKANHFDYEDFYFRPADIVKQLGATRYQVNKAIKFMKKSGYVEYVTLGGGYNDCEPSPPYNGYKLTEKGKDMARNMYICAGE